MIAVSQLSPETGSSQVQDFFSRVIETAGGGMTKLIERNTTIPAPSFMGIETAGGGMTKLIERNTSPTEDDLDIHQCCRPGSRLREHVARINKPGACE